MGRTVTTERTGGLAVLRMAREHGNAINGDLVRDLAAASREIDRDDGVRGALLAASGKLFCPGLDLRDLIRLDRPAMAEFLERFEECLVALHGFSKPMVAAMHGHAVAGGCILALAADWRVLREGAQIGLAEVRVGLPLPYPVAMMLRDSVPAARLEEIALFGRNHDGQHAVAAGLAHEIHAATGFEDHCMTRLDELASKDRTALAITKRHLRSVTLDRMRTSDARHREEFLDAWFAEAAQARLRAMAVRLSS